MIPAITRKTEDGLPTYVDHAESDVFILSGIEDLVPVLTEDQMGRIVDTSVPGYVINRYRPRIEGLFAKIERWTRTTDGEIHWRSISGDNTLTIYGASDESRVSDPSDKTRVFSWLISETRDNRGNAVVYRYRRDDGTGVDLTHAHERNRGELSDVRRTANRYLKRITYGNRRSLLDQAGQRPRFVTTEQLESADWMFDIVFDFGEHDVDAPTAHDIGAWAHRTDAFSSHRAGFEIRTTRLCRRVLVFHHFENDPRVGRDCLVRSTDLAYDEAASASVPSYARLVSVTQSAYRRESAGYEKRSFPPVEFEYTEPVVRDEVEEIELRDLEGVPIGVDGASYQWVDLHGEGIPGILTEQAGAWFYKRNLTPASRRRFEFGPLELISTRPNTTIGDGQAHFMDLAGDGKLDVVPSGPTVVGLYEHDDRESWENFRSFTSRVTTRTDDPRFRYIDLTGDGQLDLLATEGEYLVWHRSLGEEGFAEAERVRHPINDEDGPRLVFQDSARSVYLADMSGDGLVDLVRISNGQVCYWPNLGYGRFGSKISMDNSPLFDHPDMFDQRRIRLADIDGTGTSDIIYLHNEGVRLYFNQSGNSWSEPTTMGVCPRADEAVSVDVADLLGNGTACLVWSSPLPGDQQRPVRYVNLMGQHKPHLLVGAFNNLGAETHVEYAPSTKFYIQDRMTGRPWVMRLPFPVQVVERVITYDHISRNVFSTRYAYHDGHYDGTEHEFRGFAMVEQWDCERLGSFTGDGAFPSIENLDESSHVAPMYTKTWFHTGSPERALAQKAEYFHEPGTTDDEAEELTLVDAALPTDLTSAEERDALRALKGLMLRQEVYSEDGSSKARFPYSVVENSFHVRTAQSQAMNRHGVYFVYADQSMTFHYERDPSDPRVQHELTLEVDGYGNVLKQASIGYGRRSVVRRLNDQGMIDEIGNPGLETLAPSDRSKQTGLLIAYVEHRMTDEIVTDTQPVDFHLVPTACETRTFELIGYAPTGIRDRYQAADFVVLDPAAPGRVQLVVLEDLPFGGVASGVKARRQVECVRTLFRRDDLAGMLQLGKIGTLALHGEDMQLAFTSTLLKDRLRRPIADGSWEPLIADLDGVLSARGADGGGYVRGSTLKSEGLFPSEDPDDAWWIPSGRTFFSRDAGTDRAAELIEAREHFFQPLRYEDAFGQSTTVTYDGDKLVVLETEDPIGNRISVDEMDYRVLQPKVMSDPNRNRSAVTFDVLGLVVGTAVMGKPSPALVEGDSLRGFRTDLATPEIRSLESSDDPRAFASDLLGDATTRVVYDVHRFRDSRVANPSDPSKWQPVYSASIARELHVNAPHSSSVAPIQLRFSYSDGFGRQIQEKIQAEPDLVDPRPRWVGNGWTIFNNKGQPVRQYEPFFSTTHRYEYGVAVGVSLVQFYDPPGRVVATLFPDNCYEKVVFGAWRHDSYDANDTVAERGDQTGDPRTDPDLRYLVEGYFKERAQDPVPWRTWYQQRAEPSSDTRARRAATKAATHADTPTTAHLDVLGRPFLSVAHNRVVSEGHPLDGTDTRTATRIERDIEGNVLAVRDAVTAARSAQGNEVSDERGREIATYGYDLVGAQLNETSMDAGARWTLYDVTGRSIRAWDDRRHAFRSTYDPLRRLVGSFVQGGSPESDPRTLSGEKLIEKVVYGETQPNAEAANLRTRVFQRSDTAGVVTNLAVDFKGNLLRSSRRFIRDYKTIPNWSDEPAIDDETFTASTLFDALNRPIQHIAPRSSHGHAKCHVIQPRFNEAGMLSGIDVWLTRDDEPAASLDPATEPPSPVGVTNIDYNAKGQRQRTDLKSGVTTTYTHDPSTHRLISVETRRPSGFNDDDAHSPPADWPGRSVQNLRYTYDPIGNITSIVDDSQQSVFFRNKRVDPTNDYTYDAFYRLITATGREHLGQSGVPTAHSPGDPARVGILSSTNGQFAPNDGAAMGAYIERYIYDAVGNILEMQHRGAQPSQGWARTYSYGEASLIETASQGGLNKLNNRLSATSLATSGGTPVTQAYVYDRHGNAVRMPHLGGPGNKANLHWDFADRLQRVDLGGGGCAWYVYDGTGDRVRKVWEKAPGLTEERMYLGRFEIFRRHGSAIDSSAPSFERETLHVMDDRRRIAVVETRTIDTAGTDQAPAQLIRYQLGNHIGSAAIELDDSGHVISYEEYTPYGSSSYQAVRSLTETPKRYRYSSKELDEESGLYYHGARYNAAWLGRWISSDPAGLIDGPNLYRFVRNNPVMLIDPTGTDSKLSLNDPQVLALEARTKAAKSAGLIGTGKKGAQLQSFRVKGSGGSGSGPGPAKKGGSGTSPKPTPGKPGSVEGGTGESQESKSPTGNDGDPAGTDPVSQPGKPDGVKGGTAVDGAGYQEAGGKSSGVGGTGKEKTAGGTPLTELDYAVLLSSLLSPFTSSTPSKDTVSGGLPGGKGPKWMAGPVGQVAYIAVNLFFTFFSGVVAGGLQKAWTAAKPILKQAAMAPAFMFTGAGGIGGFGRLRPPFPSAPKVPVYGKPQVTRTGPKPEHLNPHAKKSLEMAEEAANITTQEGVEGISRVHLNQRVSTSTGGQIPSARQPDVMAISETGKPMSIEVMSPTDNLFETMRRNLKWMRGHDTEGLYLVKP